MQRQILNFAIDTAGLVLMLAMAATGLLLKWVLPPGSRGGQGLQLWGLTRHAWGDVHFWLALALVLLLFIHIALHWAWVCALVARFGGRRSSAGATVSRSRQWLCGMGLLVACCLLVLGFLWLARSNTTGGGGEQGPRRFRGGRDAAAVEPRDALRPATAARPARPS